VWSLVSLSSQSTSVSCKACLTVRTHAHARTHARTHTRTHAHFLRRRRPLRRAKNAVTNSPTHSNSLHLTHCHSHSARGRVYCSSYPLTCILHESLADTFHTRGSSGRDHLTPHPDPLNWLVLHHHKTNTRWQSEYPTVLDILTSAHCQLDPSHLRGESCKLSRCMNRSVSLVKVSSEVSINGRGGEGRVSEGVSVDQSNGRRRLDVQLTLRTHESISASIFSLDRQGCGFRLSHRCRSSVLSACGADRRARFPGFPTLIIEECSRVRFCVWFPNQHSAGLHKSI
jgi:hypothetical protein